RRASETGRAARCGQSPQLFRITTDKLGTTLRSAIHLIPGSEVPMVYTRHVHPRLRGRRTVAIVSTVAALVLAFAPATAAAEPPAADGAWLVAAPARVSVTIGPLRYSANPANFNAGARVDRFTGASNGIMSLPPEVTIAGVAYRVTE